MNKTFPILCVTIACTLTACSAPAPPAAISVSGEAAVAAPAPADRFLAAVAHHCGQAFAGHVVTDEPVDPDDPFAGKALVMHVRGCDTGRIAIPFHVGDDRSRIWLLSRTGNGLRLKHDHRHRDGTPDDTTLYGGDSDAPGTAQRQTFPVDAESIAMFEREGRSVSLRNVWAMEIEPGRRFLYELSRPGGRLFQVEFDLSQPVPLPPPPWGHASP